MTSCFGSCANNGKGALNTDPLTRSELCHRSKGNLSDLDTNPIPPAMTSSANRSPSIRIYLARRPIAVPQYEYTSPVDQSRSLNTNIPRPPTNRGPSIRIYLAHRPIAVPQYEYTSPADQSRSLDTNIPHPPINCSPSIRMLHRAATQRGWRSETAVDSSDGNAHVNGIFRTPADHVGVYAESSSHRPIGTCASQVEKFVDGRPQSAKERRQVSDFSRAT
eukprot:980267-Prorocentrum_minimum.AAC.1